jgi:hypothetical protein
MAAPMRDGGALRCARRGGAALRRGHGGRVLRRERGRAEVQRAALRLQRGCDWAEERARRRWPPRPCELLVGAEPGGAQGPSTPDAAPHPAGSGTTAPTCES